MIYDLIIIWAWASGIFAWINSNKNLKKIILEKTNKIWTKLLLSGWERANVTNINIDIENDYFSQNKKFLKSIFSKYSQWDFMNFCAENNLELIEEDRWRLILKNWNSKEILELFLKKLKQNNCKININSQVKQIIIHKWTNKLLNSQENQEESIIYEIILDNSIKYKCRNLIISTWWKSFFSTWTTWDWYNFAKQLWLKLIPTFPWLSWITIIKDLSFLSWISTNLGLQLIDKKTKKTIYWETGPILFTHFWLSWPIIFNTWVAIWEYLAKIKSNNNYLLDNLIIKLEFDINNSSKKIIKFFNLQESNCVVELSLHSLRGFKEAKITTGGIDLNELDNNMQVKKSKGLYFIWEIVDITWKTWWYNLQWAWSSAYVASKNIV